MKVLVFRAFRHFYLRDRKCWRGGKFLTSFAPPPKKSFFLSLLPPPPNLETSGDQLWGGWISFSCRQPPAETESGIPYFSRFVSFFSANLSRIFVSSFEMYARSWRHFPANRKMTSNKYFFGEYSGSPTRKKIWEGKNFPTEVVASQEGGVINSSTFFS